VSEVSSGVLEKQKSNIFENVRVYVTGYTEPPLDQIKKLLGEFF
jgi:hypothetical protein